LSNQLNQSINQSNNQSINQSIKSDYDNYARYPGTPEPRKILRVT
jgi:hypothetical protein